MTVPTPRQRIAQWVERDKSLGREAQVAELTARLAEAEAEIAQLRVRLGQLGNTLAQVEIERNHYRRASGAGGTLQIKARLLAKKFLRVGARATRRILRPMVNAVRNR